MTLFRIENETPVAWSGEPIEVVRYIEDVEQEDGTFVPTERTVTIRHPANIEELWSDEELAAIGLYRPLPADPITTGGVAISHVVQLVDGKVKYVAVIGPKYATAADAKAAMVQWINTFTSELTGNVPAVEPLSWPVKEVAARAYLDGSPDAFQSALIETEAAITGEEPATLAQNIIGKAVLYRAVVARITGLRRKTEAAIDASPVEHYEAILAAAIAGAEEQKAALGL